MELLSDDYFGPAHPPKPPIPPPNTPTLVDYNGFLAIQNSNYPTTSAGLAGGQLYSPSGSTQSYIYVVSGFTYTPGPAVYFGTVTASQLLALGAYSLPQTDPGVATQIWNNSGILCISAGGTPEFVDYDGFLALENSNYPSSSAGLTPGALYTPSGAAESYIYVVPGFTYTPGTPVYFGSITPAALLALGAFSLPQVDPGVMNQIWNNAGVLCISAGGAPAFVNYDGFLALTGQLGGYPTSSAGLMDGALYAPTNLPSYIYVVPGFTYVSGAAVYFGSITPAALLALGAFNLPQIDPGVVNQIWNNNGVLCISVGGAPAFANYDGFLALTGGLGGYPTSSSGLMDGALYAPSALPSYIYVVPGFTYTSGAPVYFGSITPAALLALGAFHLPQVDPAITNQIWNNDGVLCVSAGGAPEFVNYDGFLAIENSNYPASSSGLTAGALYAPEGSSQSYIYVVPGFTYSAGSAVFFGSITPAALLALGAFHLPQVDPLTLNQIWNNEGVLCVST